ncbi:MAG: aminotransferase class V-fold PLP-dependent enzyme, partial [Acutalibacteraceae bacterium]
RYLVPVYSFNVKGYDSETFAEKLSDRFYIAVRAGLHCAPLAHEYMKTVDIGTIRVCPSVFTTERDIYRFVNAVRYCIRK